jgi:hypothetical protein
MASTSNETMSTQVSSPSSIISDYLNSREGTLSHYYPEWDFTNEDIFSSSDLLKRDGTPICIPPSCDLVGGYVGPDGERADGFYEKAVEDRRRRPDEEKPHSSGQYFRSMEKVDSFSTEKFRQKVVCGGQRQNEQGISRIDPPTGQQNQQLRRGASLR